VAAITPRIPAATRRTTTPKAATLTAATTAAPAKPAAAPARPKTYTAVAGDCLWSIGQRFDVTMYAMAAANNMRLTDILQIGRVLNIPAVGTVVLPSAVEAPAPAPAPAPDPAPVPVRHTLTEHYVAPASTWHATSTVSSSSVSAGSSLESCIIQRESGGNAGVWNASGHWGLYQFSASTWAAYGGSPGAFGSASAAQQQQVYDNAIAAGGASNWTAYDGC